MVKLSGAFSKLRPFQALVIGDFLLDTYTTGRVKRISPEAPVPVLEVLKYEARPGGAGNAVLNLTALGGAVIALGRIGSDSEGKELKDLLAAKGALVHSLLQEERYRTPVKNRLIADSQQLLRVDFEKIEPLSHHIEKAALALLEEIIPTVQVLALSDYGKGFLSRHLISEAIRIAKKHRVPVIVDPKGIDFTKYSGATLLKPNLSEAYAAAKLHSSSPLEEVARQIFLTSQVDLLLITRSEAGMSLFDQTLHRTDFPVRSREVKDVTGAGDTVLAVMSLALANGLDLSHAVQLANIAAGISIEKLGCVQVRLSEIAERLLETDCQTKIFDESHTYALKQVLEGKSYSLLVLEKNQILTGAFSRILRKMALAKSELVIYVQGGHPDDELIHLLSSFQDVKTIILQKTSLQNLCTAIHPSEVFFLQGEHITEAKNLLVSLLTSQVIT